MTCFQEILLSSEVIKFSLRSFKIGSFILHSQSTYKLVFQNGMAEGLNFKLFTWIINDSIY